MFNENLQPSIFIVEDELIVSRQLSKQLSQLGYKVIGIASSGQAALMAIFQDTPDLVLMDIVIKGEIDGIETAQRIQQNSKIPIIFLTAYCNQELINRAALSGSYGYMIKPIKIEELNATIKMTLNKHDQYMGLYAQTMGGQGLRFTDQEQIQKRIEIEQARANRNQQNISIIVLVIDQLTLIRKTYGYEAENLVFDQVINHLRNVMRQTDLIYRNEDGQILILLPGCNRNNANVIAEKIRIDSYDLVVKYDDRQVWMSFSLGVDSYSPNQDIPLDNVVKSAITGVVRAQQQGGNRVIVTANFGSA
ncbi:response regulator [Synechocystis salina LEGE 06155]|nr:response regulator [Synechocystis salina LEGE 06155]